MESKFIFWMLASLMALFVTSPLNAMQDTETIAASPDEAELTRLIDSYVERRGFSGNILVARGGKVILHNAYGMANSEWNVPNSPNTRYRVGSLSKPFAATLVMSLVEQKKLSLNGTVGEYLPDIYSETPAAPITIAQLLSHTSGLMDIPNNFNDPWWQTTARLSFAPRDFAKEWIKPVVVSEPGTKWRYNNAGFILLGLIVENATGKSYSENLQEHIFGPAGMTSSGQFEYGPIYEGMAKGYGRSVIGQLEQPVRVSPSVLFSAAGIYSTAMDMFRFDRALYGDAVVNAASRASMFTVKATGPYGFGWGVETWKLGQDKQLSVVSHTGSIPGYQSYYLRSEANQDCVIILNNNNQGSVVTSMGQDLMRVLNGKPVTPAKYKLEDLLVPITFTKGSDAMLAAYEALGERRNEYDLREREYNRLGYKFLGLKRSRDAIIVLKLGVARYPESFNLYDSLGEIYRIDGQNEEALASYRQSVALNPDSESGKKAIAELEAQAE